MKKILYVVHRYAPYSGGSENYVRDMAEETLTRGHQVAVFTGEHKGDWNGIRVTSDANILLEQWDLIVVHGGDVGLQNFVLSNASKIPNPIMYLLILPSESPVCVNALKDVKYIGCSTLADWRHVEKYNVQDKSVQVSHGIDTKISMGQPGFKAKYGINKKMFLSCGGYWPNKAHSELADMFNRIKLDDALLVVTGYDNRNRLMPPDTDWVRSFLIDSREDVMSAISEADLYLLHSYSEGFGLVLLESMLNNTPWAARHIAGAETMENQGFTYRNDEELEAYIRNFENVRPTPEQIEKRKSYLLKNNTIQKTVDEILSVL